MPNKTILCIFEDIPIPNTTGYSTYNHAFISSLLLQNHSVHVLITGNRFPSIIFRVSSLMGVKGFKSQVPKAYRLFKDFYIVGPVGFLKYIYRNVLTKLLLKKPSKNRQRSTVIKIGRWLDPREKILISYFMKKIMPDVLIVDALFRTPSMANLPVNTKTILIGHDVFYQRCESLIKNEQQPLPLISAHIEAEIIRFFDAVIAITTNDEKAYTQLSPTSKIITLPAPIAVAKNIPLREKTSHILYLGSQAHHNVDGLQWFLAEIWPLVMAKRPNIILDIVGSIGSQIESNISGVVIHGRIDDISQIAAASMFAINPVRAGSGMKIKMLDYFSHGLGCITSSVGAAGFPIIAESPIAICDDNEDFVTTIVDWIANVHKCQELSTYAINFAKLFSIDEFNNQFEACINELTKNPDIRDEKP